MPLYEIRQAHELVPFRRLHGGPELYEREIEELFWDNADEFLGESLFLIKRQATLPGGGRPDILGLDSDARVVIVEVKRDVERHQLSQILEYAGWARSASLDELSGLYPGGREAFFADWQQFTESIAPVVINPKPRLVLVARDFHGRSRSAFDFLVENGLPIRLIPVAVYEDEQKRRFLDIEADHEPEPSVGPGKATRVDHTKLDGRRVRISDLLDAGLLSGGEEIVWDRPRLGQRFYAKVLVNGGIELADGRRYASPSLAAKNAADVPSVDGWYVWKVGGPDGSLLNDLRLKLAAGDRNRGGLDEGTATDNSIVTPQNDDDGTQNGESQTRS
jgi:hypothetical protein